MAEQQLTKEQLEKIQNDFVEQLKQIFVDAPHLRPIALIGYDGDSNGVVMPFDNMPFKLLSEAIIQIADGMKNERKNIN